MPQELLHELGVQTLSQVYAKAGQDMGASSVKHEIYKRALILWTCATISVAQVQQGQPCQSKVRYVYQTALERVHVQERDA